MPEHFLELDRLTRIFPGIKALSDVSLKIEAGSVHGLVGENGAGKSTLINILSGVLQPDHGTIRMDGTECRLGNPVEARRAGIVTVHQEADLFPTLSVSENLALQTGLPTTRWGLLDRPSMIARGIDALSTLDEPISPFQAADRLSIAQRQLCQIASAVAEPSRLVILDEPTSTLSRAETHWLEARIRDLTHRGVAVLYVSHRLEEIFSLCQQITVLRDGEHVWTGPADSVDQNRLVTMMVGRTMSLETPHKERESPPISGHIPDASAPRLRIRELTGCSTPDTSISLEIQPGEIVGIYGLVGSGRTEFARTLLGFDYSVSGTVEVDGQPTVIRNARDAVAAGMGFVPEDRLQQGICPNLSCRLNTVLASLKRWSTGPWIRSGQERAAALDQIRTLSVRCRSDRQRMSQLSGGNQQKLILGRWLLTNPRILVLDEPTRGIDVQSKHEIHLLLRKQAERGCAILLISSELPEILSCSDRVLVFNAGRINGEFDPQTVSAETIAAAAFQSGTEQNTESPRPPGNPATGLKPSVHRVFRLENYRTELVLGILVLLLAGWLSLSSEGFHLAGLLTNWSIWAMLGMGAAVVIIAGGIDISTGSLLALSAVVASLVLRSDLESHLAIALAGLAAVATGTAGGLLNAFISLSARVHPIVVTLGTMTIFRGLVIALCGGRSVTDFPTDFGRLAINPDSGFRGVIPLAGLVALVVAFVLRNLRSGRWLYAVGASPTAAATAGIKVSRVWYRAFAVGGFLTGLAGFSQLAISGQMQGNLGQGWELQAITIAVIGGVSISGGRGSMVGVVLAAFLMRLVNSSLVRWGIAEEQVDLVIGTMLLTAVLIDLCVQRSRT